MPFEDRFAILLDGEFVVDAPGCRIDTGDEGRRPCGENLRGFIFAVAGGPELIGPSEWLPAAFGGEMPEFDGRQRAQQVLGDTIELYNAALGDGSGPGMQPPEFRQPPLDNFERNAPARQWSTGFLVGYGWLRRSWHEEVAETIDRAHGIALVVLGSLQSPDLAEEFRKDGMSPGKSLEEIVEIVREQFESAMGAYVDVGKNIARAIREAELPQPRVGRNDRPGP